MLQSLTIRKRRVDIKCATLTTLIGFAFRHPPDRITGPDWMRHGLTRFDIATTIPVEASESQVPEMLQALLEERFKLKIHRGTASQEVFALVVAKGGLKLREAIANSGTAVVEEPTARLRHSSGA